MSSAIAVGVFSITATLLGVTLGSWISANRNRRIFRLETALELVGLNTDIWDESNEGWVSMTSRLQRLDIRLEQCKMDRDLRKSLYRISTECRLDYKDNVEHGSPAISVKLLRAFEDLQHVIRSILNKSSTRHARRVNTSRILIEIDQVCKPPTPEWRDSMTFW
jgi:hypothetical protein